MHRFIDGEDRMQQTLLPHSLEDYVSEENPVRVIEVFIDELDLAALGFAGMTPAATGRPAYHPSTLLKIYLYGYLNRLHRPDPAAHPGRLERRVCDRFWPSAAIIEPVRSTHNGRSCTLLDHLIGAGEQRLGYCQAQRLGGLEADDQLELGRRLHREVGRLLALE